MTKITEENVKNIDKTLIANPISGSNTMFSNSISASKLSDEEIFDRGFAQGLELMCKDRLLRSASSINSATIRKTTTPGLYKIILNNPELSYKVRYIDESKLVNNREYCQGTISKLNEDSYEITYFDKNDEVVIEHFSKKEAINFIKENKLIFQI